MKINKQFKRFKKWFENWKPIHLCWWFRKHGWKIPKYLIGATAWDISTAEWVQARDVSGETGYPRGIFFKSDGTKMYVVDRYAVFEYTLSTPWDISTETYIQKKAVSAQDINTYGVFFSPDGTKMYTTGPGSKEIHEYTLSTPWDVSSASFIQSEDISAYEAAPTGMFFSSDGTKMWVAGYGGNEINEFTLSTPWDVSSTSQDQARSITEDTTVCDVFFSPDGTKMYTVGMGSDEVNEYTLSTPWDISSETHVQALSVTDKESRPSGIFFKSDGTKMYIVGDGGDEVNEYNLPAAAGPASLKSVNGVATASIKSINGVPIASVKSVNGIT